MSGMIKKIKSIANMAVYQDFDWNKTVRDDKGNNIAEFKKINILYGRNYSGKTTLSRIFRALETGRISDKYDSPMFQVSFEGGLDVNQNTLQDHGQTIRVFNEDFVRKNLKFIVDDQETINSFAILGEDNARLEKKIETLEVELGSESNMTGLIGESIIARNDFNKVNGDHKARTNELEKKLKEKANNANTGIKHNKDFGFANYNIRNIQDDITCVLRDSYNPPNEDTINEARDLLREEPKPEIAEPQGFNLQYSTIKETAGRLVAKEINASDPIQELMADRGLADWVRAGRFHHEGKRDACGFCGNALPADLWEKLDKHFNKESEQLRVDIDKAISSIENEQNRLSSLIQVKASDFYTSFFKDLESLQQALDLAINDYELSLVSLNNQLQKRKQDIFTPSTFVEPTSAENQLNDVREKYGSLKKESELVTSKLESNQKEAREVLRLHEVYIFTCHIDYLGEKSQLKSLKDTLIQAEELKRKTSGVVDVQKIKINVSKAQLKDESMGAEKVNEYLNHFFGHQSLSLRAVESASEGEALGYRFEVIRNEKKAYHLSEGECGLIAFCYFIAKLEDFETKGNKPIIWIDDPISSLDSNHIFFVYSLISAAIVKKENYLQLFISTHSLDFLKYLKRLPGALNNKKSQYFIINRIDRISEIKLMPKYLKEYVTEFNYLFHQIYKCASITTITDENYTIFYNFGNNTRKFFEIYLYYKYPDDSKAESKLASFFGDESIPAILTDRVNNEYSHLSGVFERGASPVEVPEMQRIAKAVLYRIKKVDLNQYSALLKSIGEQDILEVRDLEVIE